MFLFIYLPKNHTPLNNLSVHQAVETTYVYICVSNTAHVNYATKDCRGLSASTHDIKKVTLEDAKNYYDKRACKVCEE